MNTSSDITTDLFLGGKLKIQQYKKGFRSGSDAVFLAAFLPETSGQILEIGCGAGVASLCVATRLSNVRITGIDVEENLIQLAIENAKNNKLEARCSFSVQDIQSLSFPKQTFDHVFSNPPYFDQSSPSPFPQKAVARNQIVPPAQWIKECIKMAKPRGRVSFIYPTQSLHRLLSALEGLGDIQLLPLWPSKDKDSQRILVSARKGVKCGLHLKKGLILHNDQGLYTAEANKVLRLGTALL